MTQKKFSKICKTFEVVYLQLRVELHEVERFLINVVF